MLDADRIARAAEKPGEVLAHDHRAVLPAGAADGDGQMCLALRRVLGQQVLEQVVEPPLELLRLAPLQHPLADLRAVAGESAQRLHVVRVGEKPHVEDQVGVDGYPVLVAERRDAHDEGARAARADVRIRQLLAQLAGAERARVDDLVGPLLERLEPPPLAPDPVEHAAPQRMLAAGLLEAADQDLVRRLQEQNLKRDAHAAEAGERRVERVEELAAAHVDHERHPADPALGFLDDLGKLRDQRGRQVVHAEEAQVFEGMHCLRFTRPAQSRHHQKLDAARGRGARGCVDGLPRQAHQSATRCDKTKLIALSTIAPIKAERKLVMMSRCVTTPTTYSITALMTNANSPRVRIVRGSVSSSRTGRRTALTMPNTRAASTAPPKLVTRRPGTMSVVRYSATALIAQRTSSPAITTYYSMAQWTARRAGRARLAHARLNQRRHAARQRRHPGARGLERLDLVVGRALGPRDDGPRVAHPLPQRRRPAGDVCHDGLVHALFDVPSRLLLGAPADLAEQHDRLRAGVRVEELERLHERG